MSTALTLYIDRNSRLHVLNPLTKVALTATLLTAGFALPEGWISYSIVLLIVVPLSALGRVWRQLVKATWKIVLPFAVSVFLIQGLFWGSGTPLFSIGSLSFKLEGISFAFLSVGRILLVVSVFMLFALTTRPDTLMLALTHIGLPGSFTYIVVTAIQIAPRFQARAATIVEAQRSRGLETEGNIFRRARALLPLVMPLVLSSLVDVEERAIAIEARAFNSSQPKTSLIKIPDSRGESITRWMFLLLMALAIGYRVIAKN